VWRYPTVLTNIFSFFLSASLTFLPEEAIIGLWKFAWGLSNKGWIDMCARNFLLVSMGGWVESKACTDPGARTYQPQWKFSRGSRISLQLGFPYYFIDKRILIEQGHYPTATLRSYWELGSQDTPLFWRLIRLVTWITEQPMFCVGVNWLLFSNNKTINTKYLPPYICW
jgi:hypothetical protein